MSLGDRIVQLIQAQAAPLAQARAMQGQIAGDTIRGIGQTFAAVPGQIQATKIAQQDQKMRQLQIDAAERDAKSIKAYGTALSDPANLNEDGTINDTKVGDYLRKADIGAYDKWTALSAARSKAALEAKKDLAAIQASQATTEEKQQALQKTRGDYLGRIAYSGLNMLAEKPDDPLHARDTFLAAIAHAASPSVPGAPPAIDQKQAQELIMRTAGADRSQLAQMFTSVIPPDLKAKLDKEQADIAKTNADAAKTAVEARNIELYGSATPPTAQSEKWRVKGVGDVPLQFMPGKKPGDSGHYYLTTADGKQVEKIPGRDFTAIPTAATAAAQPGADVKLTDNHKRIAADLATGMLSMQQFNRMMGTRGNAPGIKQAIYLEARDINPDFNPVAFEAGQRMFSNPQIRQRMTAIDQLTPVINQITDLMNKAGNSDLPTLNKLLQAGKFQIGNTAVTDLRQMQTLLGDEVGNALGVGTGSDLKTRLGIDLVNTDLGPKQFASTMKQLKSVLGARRNALAAMMGPYGKDTDVKEEKQSSAAPIKVGGFTVTEVN